MGDSSRAERRRPESLPVLVAQVFANRFGGDDFVQLDADDEWRRVPQQDIACRRQKESEHRLADRIGGPEMTQQAKERAISIESVEFRQPFCGTLAGSPGRLTQDIVFDDCRPVARG